MTHFRVCGTTITAFRGDGAPTDDATLLLVRLT